jgi:hypothetical protein
MPRVGVEPKIPVFEREMTFRALDSVATVIGIFESIRSYSLPLSF